MTDQVRDKAPSAQEIERRFRSPAVLAARPLIWSAIACLKITRRFGWKAQFDCDVLELDGPLVFAANHRSHADTAAILGTLPPSICRRTAVAAALDVFGPDNNGGIKRKWSKNCLQFVVAAGFHAFAFDRHGPPLRSVRTSVQLIRNDWSLLLYPEGTRSRNGAMAPFKAGVGLLARFTQRPVIPVHVEGGQDVLPYGAFLPGHGRLIVRYGAPIWYEAGDTPTSFAARLEEQVRQLGLWPSDAGRAALNTAPLTTDHAHSQARKQPA
jgi:1-acyl-sn-glycerol-3-phosphate acyltransferase